VTAAAVPIPRGTMPRCPDPCVRAYGGVPLLDAEGTLLGTLCHYDLLPRDPAQVDLELMLAVASTLALGGFVPPYPPRRATQES